MLGMLRALTYGQRLRLAERPVLVPLENGNVETWVTRSEERQQKLDLKHKEKQKEIKASKDIKHTKEKREMATNGTGTPNDTCHPVEKGYLSVDVPRIPRASTLYYFESCCCEDGSGNLLEALYQYVLAKKLVNPAILKVIKRFSPNGACNALQIDWNLLGLTPATEQDMKDIWLKYISLLVI